MLTAEIFEKFYHFVFLSEVQILFLYLNFVFRGSTIVSSVGWAEEEYKSWDYSIHETVTSFYSHKLAHIQVVLNCPHFIAHLCTSEATLAHNLGALYFA